MDCLQALTKYKQIHASHPLNVECLRYLVHLCNELGGAELCTAILIVHCAEIPMTRVHCYGLYVVCYVFAHLMPEIALYAKTTSSLMHEAALYAKSYAAPQLQAWALQAEMPCLQCSSIIHASPQACASHNAGLTDEEAEYTARMRKAERLPGTSGVSLLGCYKNLHALKDTLQTFRVTGSNFYATAKAQLFFFMPTATFPVCLFAVAV